MDGHGDGVAEEGAEERAVVEGNAEPERYDTGILIPVLIGVVAVTGALLAWRSAQLNADAGDYDQAAVADAAYVSQVELHAGVFSANLANVDLQVQVLAAQAQALREQAAAEPGGDARAIARAEELEAEAGQLLLLATNRPIEPEQLGVPYDRDDVRARFLASDRELGRHDPQAAIEEGDELRDRGLQLVMLTVALAFAAVLLTVAQISRRRLPQLGLISVAVLIWVGCVGGALATGLT